MTASNEILQTLSSKSQEIATVAKGEEQNVLQRITEWVQAEEHSVATRIAAIAHAIEQLIGGKPPSTPPPASVPPDSISQPAATPPQGT